MHEGFLPNQGEGQEEGNHFQASPKRGNLPFLPDGLGVCLIVTV